MSGLCDDMCDVLYDVMSYCNVVQSIVVERHTPYTPAKYIINWTDEFLQILVSSAPPAASPHSMSSLCSPMSQS